jgi:predicted enzyme related to lactoylglutathione lyase
VDGAISRIESIGGGVIMPPTDILNIGRFCRHQVSERSRPFNNDLPSNGINTEYR